MQTFSLLLVAAGAVASNAHPFTVCSGVKDLAGIDSVSLNPDPPVPGQDLGVTITGKSSVDITGGELNVDVTALGIKIASTKFDVCKDLGLTCPLKKGDVFSGTFKYAIPSAAPKGITAKVEAKLNDEKSNEITCIDISAKVGGSVEFTSPTQRLRSVQNQMDRKTVEFLFESWRAQHGFVHDFKDAAEFVKRMDIFEQNMYKIMAHNNHHKNTWTMSMNQFGHLTGEEFKAMYTGLNKPRVEVPATIPRVKLTADGIAKSDLADSVDWTTKGAVTPVKNQGQCGSCWSFSTTGGLEGAYFLANNNLVSFSEQQLVSCDNIDSGCNGGLMDNAFGWIESNKGLCTESDYPYTSGGGSSGVCQSSCSVVSGSAPTKFTDVDHSETALMAAVNNAPVSIAIEADQSAFQFYSGGVMTGTCGTNLDHGVLAVGYGTESGTDYWKVKNSWGESWGASGYILLERGKSQSGGQCGILMSASYPTV